MLRTLIAATLLLAGLAQAGLSDMRATIPGSLHQCENSTVFFFDTDDSGSKTLLFVNTADVTKLGSGTITLDDALTKVQPLQTVSDITSADAASFSFFLKIQEDVAFSTFGFLSNGQGKNMNLDRTVKDPLPNAQECLSQVSAPATTSTVIPVVAPSTTSKASPSSAAPPASTSGFVKALKASSSSVPKSSSSVPSTPPPASSIPVASTVAPVAAAANASSTASAPASTASNTIIETSYLLSSFISIAAEKTTDGTVSSAAILGGHVTGNFNGTILPVGTALFAPNTTIPAGSTTGNATAATSTAENDSPILLSATFTFTIDDGKYAGDAVFVMGQTPLSVNTSIPALLMHLQPAVEGLGAKWANKTVLGKPTYINSTMFRLDAYVA